MNRPVHLRRQLVAVGVFATACVAIFVVLFGLAGGDVHFGERRHVQAVVPTAVTLAADADIRYAGIRVGKVTEIAPRAGATVLELQLDDDDLVVYRDATVRVRTKTLVGENYVELDPGTSRAGRLRDGGALPLDRAHEAVQFDQILSALDRRTRRELQLLLSGAGRGLGGRGDALNATYEGSADTIIEGAPVAAVLAGERRDVATLVESAGTVMQALGDRGEALRLLARQAKAAAEAAAAEEDGYRDTLRELPETLRRSRQTVARLADFGGRAEPVLDDLAAAMRALVPAAELLPASAPRAERALQALRPFSRAGTDLLDATRSFSPQGQRAMGPLDDLLRELGPLVGYLAPYGRDAGAFFANMGSATGTYDATGALARVYAIVSRSTYASFTPEMREAFDALSDSGAAGVSLAQGTNAYPAPGKVARPEPFSGDYPRVRRDGDRR